MATQRRGEAVRELLLDVADRLFYADGIQATGVDAIVAEAGVAKSTLYRWFPTKDDLVVAFLERRDDAFWRVWDKVARRVTDPADQLLEQLRWIETWIADPASRGCPFLNTAAEIAGTGNPAADVCRRNKTELRRRFGALCGELTDGGEASRLAEGLVLLVDGAFATSQVFGDHGPHTKLVATARVLVDAGRGA